MTSFFDAIPYSVALANAVAFEADMVSDIGLTGIESLAYLESLPFTKTIHSLLETLQLEWQQTNAAVDRPWVMAQINPTTADIWGNARLIYRNIQAAQALNAELIVFPELALMGYPARDVMPRYPWVIETQMQALQWLAEQTADLTALVGFVEPRNRDDANPQGKPFYNSVAVLANGEIAGIIRKSLHPSYAEFNDARWFEDSPHVGLAPVSSLRTASCDIPIQGDGLLQVGEHRVGVLICEDGWNDPGFFDRPLYARNPIAELNALNPTVLINCSASPSRERKEPLRQSLLRYTARTTQKPLLYVNQVGAIDEQSFDGASRVFSAEGECLSQAPAFSSALVLCHPDQEPTPCYPYPGLTSPASDQTLPKTFDPFDEQDCPRLYASLVQGIRDYFRKRAFTERAVLGLSGGLDSSVVATLLVHALGPKNVLGLRLSSSITSVDSEWHADQVARALRMGCVDFPIKDDVAHHQTTLEKGFEAVDKLWDKPYSMTTTFQNVQARLRAIRIYAVANEYGAIPIATPDKSELYMGYSTIGGDMLGEFAPIADIPKCKVRTLARWMQRELGVDLPTEMIDKPSSAELAVVDGEIVNAEDDLMPYPFIDEVIWRIEALHQGPDEMLSSRFFIETAEGELPLIQKQAWIERCFSRMATSLIKWRLAPPTLIMSGNGSLANSEFVQPVTSSAFRMSRQSQLDEVYPASY